jgi:hypothetical protein
MQTNLREVLMGYARFFGQYIGLPMETQWTSVHIGTAKSMSKEDQSSPAIPRVYC